MKYRQCLLRKNIKIIKETSGGLKEHRENEKIVTWIPDNRDFKVGDRVTLKRDYECVCNGASTDREGVWEVVSKGEAQEFKPIVRER